MQYEKMVKLSDNDIARCKKLYESKDRCVRPAPPAITRCMICMETCDADAVLRTSCCGEVYCASCAPRLGSMSCPRPACGMPLDARRMLAITQDVAAVTTMLLASTRREATTPASRDGKYRVLACVTPDCPGYVTYSTGARQAFQVCQVCRTAVCVTCHTTLQNHLDKTCDNAVSQYISCMGGRVKRCPECKSPISHEGGCNTMVCEACALIPGWAPELLDDLTITSRSSHLALRRFVTELPGRGAAFAILYKGYGCLGKNMLIPIDQAGYDFDDGALTDKATDVTAGFLERKFPVPYTYGMDASPRRVCTSPWMDGVTLAYAINVLRDDAKLFLDPSFA